MKIFLVGFMGCGKSSIGKRLSRKIGYDFIDLDTFIESNNKRSIYNIISKEGEAVFRQYEKDALLSLENRDNLVVATGGGTPCFFDNMEIINKMGVSVYLKMSPVSLAKRLEDSKHSRPLLKNNTGLDLLLKIKEMLNEREKFYMQAQCILKGENAKPDHIRKLIFG